MGYYIFTRLGKAMIVNKYLFNFFLELHRSPKLPYWQLLLSYEMVNEIIPEDVRRCIYDDKSGEFVVCSDRVVNNISGINQDKSLDNGFVRSIKALGYCKHEHFENATYWFQTFSKAYDKLCRFLGEMMDRNHQHDDVGDDVTVCVDERERCGDTILKGSDCTRMEAGNVRRMVRRI